MSARFLLRLLGRRLGRVRLLLDAWFVRARLIEAALADGAFHIRNVNAYHGRLKGWMGP